MNFTLIVNVIYILPLSIIMFSSYDINTDTKPVPAEQNGVKYLVILVLTQQQQKMCYVQIILIVGRTLYQTTTYPKMIKIG